MCVDCYSLGFYKKDKLRKELASFQTKNEGIEKVLTLGAVKGKTDCFLTPQSKTGALRKALSNKG